MSRTTFTVVMVAIAAIILVAMWAAWRARARRGSRYVLPSARVAGEIVATFPRASYVSTTVAGSPLERVVLEGLGFKGWADLSVRRDGVTIQVTGEPLVQIPANHIIGTDLAGARAGKAVERDGLSILVWQTGSSHDATAVELESSFRFDSAQTQRRFASAVAEIMPANDAGARSTAHHTTVTTTPTEGQEDA